MVVARYGLIGKSMNWSCSCDLYYAYNWCTLSLNWLSLADALLVQEDILGSRQIATGITVTIIRGGSNMRET